MEAVLVDTLFVVAAVLTIGLTMAELLLKNPVHASLALIASFFPLAVIYFMMHLPFIAVVQILVYGGAIMVLFTFVIMMVDLSSGDYLKKHRWSYRALGFGAGLVVLGITLLPIFLIFSKLNATDIVPEFAALAENGYGGISELGLAMFQDSASNHYILSFELLALLILTGVIGAMMLIRRLREGQPDTPPQS